MNGFMDKYNSFGELYNSILRGNEIEFQYAKKNYYILPIFEGSNVAGVCFGEAYTENELYNAGIENTILGKIIFQSKIMWINF